MQFERKGYFCVDRYSTGEKLVINRTVPLRDSWRKIQNQQRKQEMEENQRRKREEKRKQKAAGKKS